MKPKPHRKTTGFSRFFLTGFLLAAANSAHAQTTCYWDADGDTTTETGGPGIWDATSSLWRSGSSTGILSQWPNTDPNTDTAQLEGTAGTLTLNSDSVNLNVNRITFGTTGYEIAAPASGTASVNLSGASPRITTGDAISATISAKISGSTGLTKSGAGTLTLSGNNSYTGVTTVSSNDTNGGIVNVSGDQSAANGGWSIFGTSTVNFLSGSTIAVAAGKNIALGNSAGAHSLNVAGTVTTSTTSNLNVRGRSTVTLNSGADWTQNGSLVIQPLNTGYGATMTVNSGASFTYNGTSNIILAKSNSSSNPGGASLTLSGGTFTTGKGFDNTSVTANTTGNTRLNFSNGGTLKLSADVPSLIIQGSTTFGVLTNNAAGGVIDTNGFSTTIGVAVSGAGGLTKAGAGTLTLSGTNTYAGDTTVNGGTLILGADNAGNNASTVTIGDTGVLQLTYAGTDTVDKLFIGSTQQVAGVYGHSSTGATNGGLGVGALDARFAEGTGTLTVVSGPFQTFMAGYPGLTGNDALPGADPDGDGVSNLAEFIMGGTTPDSGSAMNRPVEAVISGYLTISMLVPSGTTFGGSPSPSATVQGVQVAVGGSLDLATFTRSVEETVLNSGLASAPSGYEWHTFRLSEPLTSQPLGFLRASFIIP